MPDATTIFGPPGTGKTTTLTRNVARAVERFGAGRVAVASLTRTAATEIAKSIDRYGVDVAPENVGTLHALCYRMMDRPQVMDEKSTAEFNAMYGRALSAGRDESVDDLLAEGSYGRTESDRARALMDLLRARMVDRELWPPHVAAFTQEWEAFKEFSGRIDFSDMLEWAMENADRPPGDARALFYDEAQDGSALELALVKKWAGRTDHTVIAGDDDQAIFEWRGASVRDFLSFAERKIVLRETHRLPRAVHAYAQRWAARIGVRQDKDYAPRDADGAVEEGWQTLSAPDQWVPEVEEHLAGGRSVMLLATCGYMLAPTVAALRSAGVPFHNPYRASHGGWNPLAPHRGTGPAQRLALFARLSDPAAPPWTRREVREWSAHLRSDALVRGAKVRPNDEGADRPMELAELEALVGHDALGAALAGDLAWFSGALLASKAGSYAYPLEVARRRGVPALRRHLDEVQGEPGRGLVVGTVHSVKGGESDVVYLWPTLSPQAAESWVEGGRDEVLRVVYVGLTRARERVVLGEPGRAPAVDWLPVEG